ncbi:MAG: ABC transporter permease [Pirellulales bacterium]|nr:ABC transporter permease [Pirellulales bacterium]
MIEAVLRTVREAGQSLGVWTLLGIFLVVLVGLLLIGRVPLRYNARNLSARWRTTLLTSLAFTLVIALLTVMLAFVNSMQRMTESTGNPANVLVLADGSTDEAFSNLSPGDVLEVENLQGSGVPAVLEEHGRRLVSRETYMIVNQPIPDAPAGRPKRRFLQLRGCDDPWLTGHVHDIDLFAGKWFSYAGVREIPGMADETAIEAVVGLGAAIALGRDRSPEELRSARNPDRLEVGDTFHLGERTWVVTGILVEVRDGISRRRSARPRTPATGNALSGDDPKFGGGITQCC